jgi:hypothetical protein
VTKRIPGLPECLDGAHSAVALLRQPIVKVGQAEGSIRRCHFSTLSGDDVSRLQEFDCSINSAGILVGDRTVVGPDAEIEDAVPPRLLRPEGVVRGHGQIECRRKRGEISDSGGEEIPGRRRVAAVLSLLSGPP